MKAREHLDAEVPVLLFSWVYDFQLWYDKQYPQAKYGNVIWDTHLYTKDTDTVDEALSLYDADLLEILKFQRRQFQDVIVGEFSVSNLQLSTTDESTVSEWQRYANGVFKKLKERAKAGALFWNFDC